MNLIKEIEAEMESKISLDTRENNSFVISLEGFINNDEDTDKFSNIFNDISAKNPTKIILNFKKTQYINSSVLGVMVHFYKLMPQTKMAIFCDNPFIKELFAITAIDKLFEFLDSEEEI
ncbi:MAG: STAS domain-containing protein [Candidatus Muiribacteriota bacterium]